jgi:hypothetical protein
MTTLITKLRGGSKTPSLPGQINDDRRWLQFEQRRAQLEAAATVTREQIERAEDARNAAVAALTEAQVHMAMAIGLGDDAAAAARADRGQQTITALDRELATLRARLAPQLEACRRYAAQGDELRKEIAVDQRAAIQEAYVTLTTRLAQQLEAAAPINRQLLELRARFPEATTDFAFLDVLRPLVVNGLPNHAEVWRRAIEAHGITCDL